MRPDGKISLPLVNDVSAAGLTVEQLRASHQKAAAKYVEEPTVSVVVKADQQPARCRSPARSASRGPIRCSDADDGGAS